jgi:hypothetical protein
MPLNVYSTQQVADELDVSVRRVRALAKNRGLGKIVGGSYVFTLADIDAMRIREPGRPWHKEKRPLSGQKRGSKK